MELFYSKDIEADICRLDSDESGHCIKVLRHRCGDEISVIDGRGTFYRCSILNDSYKGVEARIMERHEGWGVHPYNLHLAVCPTKNNERYEWFVEKACEMGLDRVTPIIGNHSQRRVFKTSRIEKILTSATKQSLKATIPHVEEVISVEEFIRQHGTEVTAGTPPNDARNPKDGILRLIAYCFEDETLLRRSIKNVLEGFNGREIIIMIGPEGDFSHEEAQLALKYGFIPVHLGSARLRTETAALAAAAAVYFRYME